jgi:hypothetical protein
MKTNQLPKIYKCQEIDFWNALQQEETRAIEELEEAIMLYDPIAKAKALARLKRVIMDYFVEKYLDFLGNHRGYPCYRIDYSYHKDWQNGCDFSINSEIQKIVNR